MPSSHDAIPEVPSASPAGPGEEEPRLRYGSLDADAPHRPSQSTTTRLCVSDKVLAVGHRDGTVELLDHLGNQVGPGSRLKAPRHRLDGACSPARRLAAPTARCPSLFCLQVKAFKEHTREVTDLSFDATSEYLASSSADGSLALHGLYSDEVQRVKVAAPVTVRGCISEAPSRQLHYKVITG
jgi:WD40 repeat protein